MLFDSNGSHARSSSTVGNGECLVKIQMAHICPEEPWRGEANLCIHVCTIHIDLASVFVDDLTHLLHSVLVFACSGRESDHVSSKLILVFLGLGSEIFHVHSSVFHLNNNDLKAC